MQTNVNRHFISGDDKILATLKADSSITGESSILTKVDNLIQMLGSATCPGGGGTFRFDEQNNHDCLFYGTARDNGMTSCDSITHPGVNCTNDAILAIANEFSDRQVECIAPHPPNPNCLATLDDGVTTETINLPHNSCTVRVPCKPIIITAMSLPWGGLNDVGPKLDNGNCVLDCNLVLWHTPHQVHHNGKQVDITVRNLDRHLKLLLRQVILDNHYGDFSSLARCEGATDRAFPGFGNLVTNVQACIPTTGQASHGLATHIHVNFAN